MTSDQQDSTSCSLCRGHGRGIKARDFLWVAGPIIALAYYFLHVRNIPPGLTSDAAVIPIVLGFVGVAATVAAAFIEKFTSITHVGKAVSILGVLLILVGACVWPRPFSDDNVNVYLKGNVKIGVRDGLPGWMVHPNDPLSRSGFDGKLINFLEREYGFKAEIVKLSQSERIPALTGGRAPDQVDLVINVFSMTRSRMNEIDMAGPYFVDRAVVYQNDTFPRPAKKQQIVTACTVNNTTGDPILQSHAPELRRHNLELQVVTTENLGECVNEFKQGKVALTAVNWAIMRALEPNMPLVEIGGKPITNNDPGLGTYQKEAILDQTTNPLQFYGIGLRKGHPEVCRKLTEKLVKFISTEWDAAFHDLNSAGVEVSGDGDIGEVIPNWHRPELKDLDSYSCAGSKAGSGDQSQISPQV